MITHSSMLLIVPLVFTFFNPQPSARQVVLHNGYESGKWVRNHTVLYYTHQSKEKTEGYVIVNRVIEYAVNEMAAQYAYHYQTDTLCYFSGGTRNGKREGTFLSRPDGNIFYLHTFSGGKENGPFRGFFHSGQLYCTGTYQRGIRTGWYLQYYANGKMALQEQWFDDERKVIQHEEYDIEGRISARGYLINQLKVNEWQYFLPDGRREKTEYYSPKGRLIAVRSEE